MSTNTAQDVYEAYCQTNGFAPKNAQQLTAFAKQKGVVGIKYKDVKKLFEKSTNKNIQPNTVDNGTIDHQNDPIPPIDSQQQSMPIQYF